MAFLLPMVLWTIGYGLAPDPDAYLATHDVSAQVPFLTAHFVSLRMLGGLFARGSEPSLGGLGVTPDTFARFRRGLLGLAPNLAGLAAGAYWIVRDTTLSLVPGDNGLTAFDDPDQWDLAALGLPQQHVLLGIWILEWVVFGMILWVQIWSMVGLALAIRRTDFKPHLHRIMVKDEYRDFFALIAKNATVCSAFALLNLGFIAFTGELLPKPTRSVTTALEFLEEMSDLTSVAVLFVVIVAGYVGYVFLIRRALTMAIDEAFAEAGDSMLEDSAKPLELSGSVTAEDLERLRIRLNSSVALLRAIAFQREVDALGARGLSTLMAKALPVLATVGLRIYKLITHQPPVE